jgi:hypothetical protein
MQARSQKDAGQVLPFMRATCGHLTTAHHIDMHYPCKHPVGPSKPTCRGGGNKGFCMSTCPVSTHTTAVSQALAHTTSQLYKHST